jgi:hypothetical protein
MSCGTSLLYWTTCASKNAIKAALTSFCFIHSSGGFRWPMSVPAHILIQPGSWSTSGPQVRCFTDASHDAALAAHLIHGCFIGTYAEHYP